MQQIEFIDSHTAGEPTRAILEHPFHLGGGTVAQQRDVFKSQFDHYRQAFVCEPRGNDVLVGALLCTPQHPEAVAGVIFFNNVGFLGMCGHGTIGVMRTLQYLGKITTGTHMLETPVGLVQATLHPSGEVSIENVPSYRYLPEVRVQVPQYGEITGDVAYGGNWFFLSHHCPYPIEMSQIEELTAYTWSIRQALAQQGITGKDGAEIDHIEVFADTPTAHSRSFVLCPGKAYDRSPCGTGSSAKVACLAASGKLQAGETWVQESVIGSQFKLSYRLHEGEVIPTVSGTAHITARGVLVLDPTDPFVWGI